MKIYTKTGDDGETGLYAGPRVGKDHTRIEAYGTVDELNSVLGMVRAESLSDPMDSLLGRIQNELFIVGAQLATPKQSASGAVAIEAAHILNLEAEIDRFEQQLKPLKQFILPGGVPAAAGLHMARSVCRRAERRLVALHHLAGETVSDNLLAYLNRLSDFLFVAARAANAEAGREEAIWRGANR